MANQEVTEAKNVRKKDLLFVCSMLTIYAVCCITAVTGSVIWVRDNEKNMRINATATVVAHATEQAQYKFIEDFDDGSGHWRVGEFKNYGGVEGSMTIKDGIYILKVDKIMAPLFQQTDFFNETPIKDFDVYVDIKFTNGTSGNVCGGLDFRRSFKGWWHGVYILFICDDSTYMIAYRGENRWDVISGRRFSEVIKPSDWNRLEVSARGDNFIFTINNLAVYQMTDNRQEEGALGIAIQVTDENPTIVNFDNFGYQPH